MVRRFAFLASLAASLAASLGVSVLVSPASAEEMSFDAPVTGVGKWHFQGPLIVEDGKFDESFSYGNGRMQVWGKIEGDSITVSGSIKVPGLYSIANRFQLEGRFRGDRFSSAFTSSIEYGMPFRGQITIVKPQAAQPSQDKAAASPPAESTASTPPTQPTPSPAVEATAAPAPAATAPAQPTPAPVVETATGPTPESLEPKLTRTQRRAVQEQLAVLGFYDRAVDGNFGPGTRTAIKRFQTSYGLPATGYVEPATQKTLVDAAQARRAQLAAAAETAAPEQSSRDAGSISGQVAQETAKTDDSAAEEQARALTAQLEKDRQALEAQKAELKRQQDELLKAQQEAAQQSAEAERKAMEEAARLLEEKLEQEKQALEKQKAELKRQQEELLKAQQQTPAPQTATAQETRTAAAPEEGTQVVAAAPVSSGDFASVIPTLEPIDAVFVAIKPAKVRTEPSVAAPRVRILDVGEKIAVLGRLPGQDWYLVASDDVPIGYVVASLLAPESDATRTTTEQAAGTQEAITVPDEQGLPPELANLEYGRYHALVIGNNNYRSLPKLDTAVADAEAVADLLDRKYHFNVQLMTDASEEDIIGALTNLRRQLEWGDNLLIYYAGHGWYDNEAEQGYWLPVDAAEDNESNWISNSDVTNSLKALKAKHILVVADSCYSGTLARSANISLRGLDYIERIVKKKARTVLTSGGLEPVLDGGGGGHSVFASAFIAALEENDSVIDGQELFRRLRDPVVANAPQTPEYGDIRGAGHDGGDFLFVAR